MGGMSRKAKWEMTRSKDWKICIASQKKKGGKVGGFK